MSEEQQQAKPIVVEVAKYGDRIPVTLNQTRSLDDQLAKLCDSHGDGAVFVNGESVAAFKSRQAKEDEEARQEANPPALSGSSRHDSEIKIGETTVSLSNVVTLAFEHSGLTRAEWNDLPDAERELEIDDEIAVMRKAAEPIKQENPEKRSDPAKGVEAREDHSTSPTREDGGAA